MDETKWNARYDPRRDFPVYDDNNGWEEKINEYPVAFFIGETLKDENISYEDLVETYNFKKTNNDFEGIRRTVLYNEKFEQSFPMLSRH